MLLYKTTKDIWFKMLFCVRETLFIYLFFKSRCLGECVENLEVS